MRLLLRFVVPEDRATEYLKQEAISAMQAKEYFEIEFPGFGGSAITAQLVTIEAEDAD